MKRSELIFNIVSIPVDIISLFLAGLMSFYIRLRVEKYFPVQFAPDQNVFTQNLGFVVLATVVIFAFSGLYNLRGTRRFISEFSKIIGAISVALLAIVFIFFFDSQFFNSRLIILIGWLASIVIVTLGRFALKKIQVAFLNRGSGLHNLVIVDVSGSNRRLAEEIKKDKRLGFNVVAEITNPRQIFENLEELYKTKQIEEILQIDPEADSELNGQLLNFARNKGLAFNYVPNLFNVQQSHIETETLAGTTLIHIKNTPLTGWGSVVKRIFDLILGLAGFLITLPFFIVIAVIIKLDSPGKVLYSAMRGGSKKDFVFFKFRTMYQHLSVGEGFGGEEAEKVRAELWKKNARGGKDAAFLKVKDDPRVTKFGKFLRKTKLDEIPQFLNVLKGDMSLVGPRAHIVEEVNRYRDQHRRIFSIKPGIFGLSQIAQLSWPDLPFEEEIKLNTYYIENWSVWLDLMILARSFYFLLFAPKIKGDY